MKTKRPRPASFDETLSEEEFEPKVMTPRMRNTRTKIKSRGGTGTTKKARMRSAKEEELEPKVMTRTGSVKKEEFEPKVMMPRMCNTRTKTKSRTKKTLMGSVKEEELGPKVMTPKMHNARTKAKSRTKKAQMGSVKDEEFEPKVMTPRMHNARTKTMNRTKKARTGSLKEEEFEPKVMTPRMHNTKTKTKSKTKKAQMGSDKDVEKSSNLENDHSDISNLDIDGCDKCRENNSQSDQDTSMEKYKEVEDNMNKLFSFTPRKSVFHVPAGHGSNSFGNGKSIMDFLSQRQLRGCLPSTSPNTVHPIVSLIANLQLYRTASPFDRRVTSMAWHPTRPNILAAGSKSGDIIIWDTDQINNEKLIQGIGPGGSIQAMKFWPNDTNLILTSSIDGTVKLHDILGKKSTVLSDTFNCHDYWYCCVDVNPQRRMVVTGDNMGTLKMITPDGNKILTSRLHKNKITHAEFHPREDWLLCTASTDCTVKMWDVRKIKDKTDYLESLVHKRPVNSAYFSPSDGCRLLTTDQCNELRVYRAPYWQLETTVLHPHRFFQHITPIKANWHPFQDLIVVGRYPDPKFPGYVPNEMRSTDVFNAETGKRVAELYDPGASGIKSLHQFNMMGDRLAVAMGYNILLWTRMEHAAEKQQELLEKFKKEYGGSNVGGQGRPGGSRSQPRQRKKKGDDEDDIAKLKKKIKAKTKSEKDGGDDENDEIGKLKKKLKTKAKSKKDEGDDEIAKLKKRLKAKTKNEKK